MNLKLWCASLVVICLGQMNLAAGTDLTTVPCTSNTQCTANNSVCDNAASGAKCKCSAGYKLNTAKDGCEKVIGSTCAVADNCSATDPNANCTGGQTKTCTCKPTYGEKDNVCTLILGGSCTKEADCTGTDQNSNCTGNAQKTCTCKANYEAKNNVCTLLVSSKSCTGTTCPGIANAECANTKCKCSEGFTETADTCTQKPVVSSKPCTGTTCPGIANAECVNLKCKCSDGFTETADTCTQKSESGTVSVGVSMSALLVCLLAGLEKVF